MIRSPEYPDLSAVGIEMNGSEPPVPIEGGAFNSDVFRVGTEIVKISKNSMSNTKAEELVGIMMGEHAALEDIIGEHMPPTDFIVAETEGRSAHAVTLQPFVEGISIKELLEAGHPTEALEDFLEKCKEVFRETGLMPDIAHIQHRWFSVFLNGNIKMQQLKEDTDADKEFTPILVDTTFGKLQRHKLTGDFWSKRIYWGAVRAQMKLRGEL